MAEAGAEADIVEAARRGDLHVRAFVLLMEVIVVLCREHANIYALHRREFVQQRLFVRELSCGYLV